MTTPKGATVFALKLERAYLAALRVLILVFATLCLLGAGLMAADGARRAMTPTKVEPAPVTVTAQEALEPLVRTDSNDKGEAATQATSASAEARRFHEAFLRGPFETYYQYYRRLAVTYNKPEDGVLDKKALAERLGYTPEALDEATSRVPEATAADAAADAAMAAALAAAGTPPEADAAVEGNDSVRQALLRTSNLFQRDAEYGKVQLQVVAQALADPRLTAKAVKYKAAEKTAQSCSTVYRARTLWDPRSTACYNWYEEPYGCRVRRSVPVQECAPAYPEGVESPLESFVRLDESYRMSWAGKTATAEGEAAVLQAEKESVKEGAPASFLNGARIFAAFLVVMFLFLLIAIERHLRPADPMRVPAE